MSLTVHVGAVAAFTPGVGTVQDWVAQAFDDGCATPDASLLPRATNRRATPLTRMVAHVMQQLCEQGSVSAAQVGLVLGTVGGELQTTFACLALADEDPPASSPLRFRNSLHNSALGHLSIAIANRGFASAVAASRPDVAAMALLEGATFVRATHTPCVVVLADECWPTEPFTDLAAGVLLTPDSEGSLGELGLPHRGQASLPMRRLGAPGVRANPCVSMLDAVSTILTAPAGTVALGPVAQGWVATWAPRGRA